MKTLTLQPSPGSDIRQTIIEAIFLAKDNQCRVNFKFNDTWMFCLPNSSIEKKIARWRKQLELNQRVYKSRPATKHQVNERVLKDKRDQVKLDILLSSLEALADNEFALLSWLSEYATLADNVGVEPELNFVLNTLLKAGWKDNSYIGIKKYMYDNTEVFAAYIIGQAISCMKKNMPPHPVLCNFVEKYKEKVNEYSNK